MHGEGVIDFEKVLIVKTHFPERIGHSEFQCEKCILITRNPLDSICSLFNMVGTTSHSKSITSKNLENPEVQDLWVRFVEQESPVWNAFHKYWFDFEDTKIITHITRYEDLMFHPEQALKDLSKFIFEIDDMDNLVIPSAIDEILKMPKN